MSDAVVAERPRSPANGSEPCACGSGLTAAHCCSLELARFPRTPPDGRFDAQVKAMSSAIHDGEVELADRLAREILEQAPGFREALGALYNIRRDQGRLTAAEALVTRLARLYPNDTTSQMVAAHFFMGKGDPARATPFARMLVRLAPESAPVHLLMGQVFNGSNQAKAAEHHFRRVMVLGGDQVAEAEAGLGVALRGQGRFPEARKVFARVLERGENLNILLSWASLEEADHQFDAAVALLDRAAALSPNGPRVALGRATLLRRRKAYGLALEALDGLDLRFEEVGMSAASLLEKGHVLDALGRYDEAFETFSDFKRKIREQTGQVYAAEHAKGVVDRLADFFTDGRSRLLPRAGIRTDSPQPIFVVGFPRSGTTLVEQTLTSHPAISAGDELQIIGGMVERMQALLNSPAAYPVALSELWLGDRAGQIDTLRDFYLNEAARLGATAPDRRWFTDKMPLNETHLGLISLLFPRSPVIHLVRHPLDVVLSVFSNGLSHGFNCAAELETAARHYALIAELIQHYLREMPIHYKAVRYEDLVVDQEREVRALFDFIGEPFDPRTLDFHENVRPARTASYAQVAEKLYDRSRYRYRNYRRQLEPVIPILEPAIHQLGYTIED